jgi:lysophospholipase L1-like esterase
VILMGILPVSDEAKWAKCRQTNAVNAALARNEGEVVYLDLQDQFLQADGSLDKDLFTDGTHLTPEGYRAWAEGLDSLVSGLMDAAPIDPVKIMLIGGSITEGSGSSGAYRRYLDGMLRRAGNLIDFVGSRRRHYDDQAEPDSYEYDPDHEGHWGRNSDWLARNMAGLLTEDAPDVAVIHMGTEDIVSGSGAAESLTERIVGNIGKVIEALRSRNETVKIVLARIIPARGKADEVNLLNLKISRHAAAHSTPRSPVVVADQHAGFRASSDLADDGVLPNAVGAEKMAHVFAGVINNILGGTGRIRSQE